MDQFNFEKIADSLKSKNLDFSERTIPFHLGMVKLYYILQLTDRAALIECVVKPLVLHCSSVQESLNSQMTIDGIIFADQCRIESDISKIEDFILSGMVVMLFSTDDVYIVANFRKVEHRPVPSPALTYTVRGPQDCFTENLDVNLSLLRYRLKDKNMQIKKYEVGARTKTEVAVIYIEDIANNTVVTEVQKRIQSINVDGIGESGELQNYLLDKKIQLFPTMGLVERSDLAYHTLLEGKVLVLVEGSGIALNMPKLFTEFFYSCDDRYDHIIFGYLARMFRYTAIIIAFTATSVFVAVTSFHTDILPSEYAISLAKMRGNVPFTALIGALVIEFIVELLRESLTRIPKQIGPAIGIVGAIVIGQAAIAARIFSPLLLMIVSISLLASFAIPDYTLMTPFRVLKFVLLLCTGALGFFGFSLFLTLVLAELVSLKSFGVPYLAPWAPFNLYDFLRSLMNNGTISPERPKYLRTKDKTRMKE